MIKRGSDGVITQSDMLDLFCPFPTANIQLCVSAVNKIRLCNMVSRRPANKNKLSFDLRPQPNFCMKSQEAGNKNKLK